MFSNGGCINELHHYSAEVKSNVFHFEKKSHIVQKAFVVDDKLGFIVWDELNLLPHTCRSMKRW